MNSMRGSGAINNSFTTAQHLDLPSSLTPVTCHWRALWFVHVHLKCASQKRGLDDAKVRRAIATSAQDAAICPTQSRVPWDSNQLSQLKFQNCVLSSSATLSLCLTVPLKT